MVVEGSQSSGERGSGGGGLVASVGVGSEGRARIRRTDRRGTREPTLPVAACGILSQTVSQLNLLRLLLAPSH